MTSASNALSGISWNGVTRPSRGTLGAVPHPASDPVLEASKRRVMEFLRTTFFDNAPALECQLAATRSTLRGSNIVRAFMTLGPGSVGQRVNTALIANVFGDMHGFMNVF